MNAVSLHIEPDKDRAVKNKILLRPFSLNLLWSLTGDHFSGNHLAKPI